MARLFNGTVLTALAAGFVGGMLAPVLMPNGAKSARAIAKGAIKAGLALYERGREQVTELGETASDLIAEVQAEREEEIRTRYSADSLDDAETARTPVDLDAARGRRYDA
ncbi:MAG TPA: DUF5132 domain-containing protein [Azospirillum sp.]|nr:DUF5132 domain-containing protein [Azospirillum sp.]